MEERSSYLKYIFSLECFLGTSVASYETIGERRPFQYVWTVFLILVAFINAGYDLYGSINGSMNHSYYFLPMVNRFVRDILILYLLNRGLKKENRKVTAGKHLDAIKDYLRGLNIDLPGTRLETFVVVMSLMIYIVHIVEVVIVVVMLMHKKKESGSYILYTIASILYFQAVKFSQAFGCNLLLIRCLRIQLALNKQLERLGPRCEEEDLPVVAVVHRREAWVEGTEVSHTVLTAMRTVHSVLAGTDREVKSAYWVFVAWLAFTSSVNIPSLTLYCIFNNKLLFWGSIPSLLFYPVLCLVITLTQSLQQNIKESIEIKLSKLLRDNSQEEHRRSIRRQLRAFQSSESFDCYFFDVDYSLIATILETTMLVVCTMLSYSL